MFRVEETNVIIKIKTLQDQGAGTESKKYVELGHHLDRGRNFSKCRTIEPFSKKV